jgi:hypothetical protein
MTYDSALNLFLADLGNPTPEERRLAYLAFREGWVHALQAMGDLSVELNPDHHQLIKFAKCN